MPKCEPTFQELLSLARAGDVQAIEQISQMYEADLLIAARVHLGPALRPYLDSIDLVQSVQRSLLLGLRKDKFLLTDARGLLALALTMLRRKVARQWRRHRRQTRTCHEHPTELLASLSRQAVNPAAVAEARDAMERLWSKLDEDDRVLIDMRLQGYSMSEVAQRLKTTPETLRVRLHRLRKRLEAEQVFSDWL